MSGLPPPVLVTLSPSQRRWAQISMGRRADTPPPADPSGPALKATVHAKKPIKVRLSYWEAIQDLAHYYDESVHQVLNRFIEDGLRRYDNGDLNLQERAGIKPLRHNPFAKLPTHGPPVVGTTPPPIENEYEYGDEEPVYTPALDPTTVAAPRFAPLEHPATKPIPANFPAAKGMPFMPQGVGTAMIREDA